MVPEPTLNPLPGSVPPVSFLGLPPATCSYPAPPPFQPASVPPTRRPAGKGGLYPSAPLPLLPLQREKTNLLAVNRTIWGRRCVGGENWDPSAELDKGLAEMLVKIFRQ